MNIGKSVLAVMALGGAAMFSPAQAAWVDCPSNISDSVSGATDCEFSTTADQDNTTPPLVVNGDGGLFGYTDWVFLDKSEDFANGQSGSFDLTGITDYASYGDLALVFKSGNNTYLVGFLLGDGVYSGSWTSPFENPPFDVKNTKDVSHISVYGRSASTSVPEPGTLALFSLGLLGAAFAGRRRK